MKLVPEWRDAARVRVVAVRDEDAPGDGPPRWWWRDAARLARAARRNVNQAPGREKAAKRRHAANKAARKARRAGR